MCCCALRHPIMSFNLEKPRFTSTLCVDPLEVSAPDVPLQQSSSSLLTPSSGDSARHLCPRRHGRMSSFSLDKQSFCCKCHGANCNFKSRCDECVSRSVEEMESYVKLRKSLVGKSHNKKSNSTKAPSSHKPVASLSLAEVDEHISGHFDSLSQSFGRRFELLSSAMLERFTELANSMSARLSNPSFSAEPEVNVLKLFHG